MTRSAEVGPSHVVTAISDAVATVTLNRPERLNAVTPEMFSRLRQVLDMVSRRTDVRVVVITGAGRAFCAGVDLVHRSTDDVTGEKLRKMYLCRMRYINRHRRSGGNVIISGFINSAV